MKTKLKPINSKLTPNNRNKIEIFPIQKTPKHFDTLLLDDFLPVK